MRLCAFYAIGAAYAAGHEDHEGDHDHDDMATDQQFNMDYEMMEWMKIIFPGYKDTNDGWKFTSKEMGMSMTYSDKFNEEGTEGKEKFTMKTPWMSHNWQVEQGVDGGEGKGTKDDTKFWRFSEAMTMGQKKEITQKMSMGQEERAAIKTKKVKTKKKDENGKKIVKTKSTVIGNEIEQYMEFQGGHKWSGQDAQSFAVSQRQIMVTDKQDRHSTYEVNHNLLCTEWETQANNYYKHSMKYDDQDWVNGIEMVGSYKMKNTTTDEYTYDCYWNAAWNVNENQMTFDNTTLGFEMLQDAYYTSSFEMRYATGDKKNLKNDNKLDWSFTQGELLDIDEFTNCARVGWNMAVWNGWVEGEFMDKAPGAKDCKIQFRTNSVITMGDEKNETNFAFKWKVADWNDWTIQLDMGDGNKWTKMVQYSPGDGEDDVVISFPADPNNMKSTFMPFLKVNMTEWGYAQMQKEFWVMHEVYAHMKYVEMEMAWFMNQSWTDHNTYADIFAHALNWDYMLEKEADYMISKVEEMKAYECQNLSIAGYAATEGVELYEPAVAWMSVALDYMNQMLIHAGDNRKCYMYQAVAAEEKAMSFDFNFDDIPACPEFSYNDSFTQMEYGQQEYFTKRQNIIDTYNYICPMYFDAMSSEIRNQSIAQELQVEEMRNTTRYYVNWAHEVVNRDVTVEMDAHLDQLETSMQTWYCQMYTDWYGFTTQEEFELDGMYGCNCWYALNNDPAMALTCPNQPEMAP